MQTSRRDFFKIAAVGGVAATVFGFDLKPAYAQLKELKIARAAETRSTCPYCAVGCGVLIYTIGDKAKNVTPQVIHVEGDPDHPTNRGTLCPKGSSLAVSYTHLDVYKRQGYSFATIYGPAVRILFHERRVAGFLGPLRNLI